MKYTEILVLKDMLEKEGIPFEFKRDFYDGYRLRYPAHMGCVCSVIQHKYSYGNFQNLLEIAGLLTKEEAVRDSVLGFLTAEEVFMRIKEHWNRRADDGKGD